VGYSDLNAAAKEILNGSFLDCPDLPGLLPKTCQMIMELTMPNQIKCRKTSIPLDITDADFIAGFKKWKECTLTSQSHCHLGQYKSIINVTHTASIILSDLVSMIKFPLKNGFAPHQIERICVIHLLWKLITILY
jgi:hypothetical protein